MTWPLTVTMGSTAQMARVADAIDGLAPEVEAAAVAGTGKELAAVSDAVVAPAKDPFATLESFIQEHRALVQLVQEALDGANAELAKVRVDGRSVGIGGARIGAQRLAPGSRDAAADALEYLGRAEAARAKGQASSSLYVPDATGHEHYTGDLEYSWEALRFNWGSLGDLYHANDALQKALKGEPAHQLRRNVEAAAKNTSDAVELLGYVTKRLDDLQTANDNMVEMDRTAQVRRDADAEVRALPANSQYLELADELRRGGAAS